MNVVTRCAPCRNRAKNVFGNILSVSVFLFKLGILIWEERPRLADISSVCRGRIQNSWSLLVWSYCSRTEFISLLFVGYFDQ